METQKRKIPKAFRLSDVGERLLATIAGRLGVNQTAVVEMAIRRMATVEGIAIPANRADYATSPAHAQEEAKE